MDALWSSQRNSGISTYHRLSIHWVRFLLCLHRRRIYCHIKSRRAQAQFSGCISASRFVLNHPKPREVHHFLDKNFFFWAIASKNTVFTSAWKKSYLLWIFPFHNQLKASADVLVWWPITADLSLIVFKSCILSPICSSVAQSILLWHPKLKRFSPPWNNIYLTWLSWAT